MKQFFKIVFGSMVGFTLSITFFILVSIIGIIGIASFASKSIDKKSSVKIEGNSILHLKLNQTIPDRSNNDPLQNFDFNNMQPNLTVGLNEYLLDIKSAKTDDNIEGVFLDLSYTPSEFANIEEVRNQLLDFKKSGKFIYAYGDYYSQTSYYIATVADSIFMNPKGVLEFKGLHSSIAFLKNALDKLGIEIQVIRHGKFKGAVEPFMKDHMSEENRLQIKTFITSIWNHLLNNISKARNIPVDKLQIFANNLEVSNAKKALDNKILDRLIYRDELLELLKTKTNKKSINDLKLVNLSKYNGSNSNSSSNKIAIIYAEGEITNGKNDQNNIGADNFMKTIRKARLDENVKSIVLRINSPGGSALASEIMWREVELTKKVKPVIVSMGNLAASGGYYMGCNADTIVASPTTITGSIGVFGVLPNAKGLISDKLGVNIDVVSTNNHSDIAMPYRALDEFEKNKIQEEVNNVYDDFTGRVADGRNMNKSQVDEIAQGRIWCAIDAKQIGLVDILGGLNTAIEIAAFKANLKKYSIEELPKPKSPLEFVMESFGTDIKSYFIKSELDESYTYYKQLKSVIKQKGIQAKIPFELNFN